MPRPYGPQLPFSDYLHATKYRTDGESFREAMYRIAGRLKDSDQHFDALSDALLDMRFMPAGRIQAAVGSPRRTTPYNCYVSGTIEDSYVKGPGSIMDRAKEAAATMQMGGGIGYDFSTLRPRGDLIRSFQSKSSGPLSFMDIFDAVCRCTASAGNRRGAQMAVLRIDHPDSWDFIHAKHGTGRFQGFNTSLAVTDEFMECLETGRPFQLRFGGRTYREVDAGAMWEAVMRSTWDWAEPGVLFIDAINRMNNLYYCESIAATNPCGEQPLPPHGACLLGSFNLVRYVDEERDGRRVFDWAQLEEDIPQVVRAMDNVIDMALYPLPAQQMEAWGKRRMGLGVTGLANAGEALGQPYGSSGFLRFERRVLTAIRDHAYMASAGLAAEKGPFPMYDAEKYLHGRFVQTLPEHVRGAIREHGIRNSHLTSIAPTGTISMAADNVSSGLEPVFSYSQRRTLVEFDGPRPVDLEDYGFRVFGTEGRVASEVTADEHLGVLATAAGLVDSSVSKTCNVSAKMPWDDFKELYRRAWKMGCKGLTTFNSDGKLGGVLVERRPEQMEMALDEGSSCLVDLETGRRSCE